MAELIVFGALGWLLTKEAGPLGVSLLAIFMLVSCIVVSAAASASLLEFSLRIGLSIIAFNAALILRFEALIRR